MNLSISYKQTEDLFPYAMNSRTHSDEQVAQIAASIMEFGFTNPILVDEKNSIIAGHGRLLAAKRLKLSEVPTIELTGLSEAQRKACVIADNKLALNANWDYEYLRLDLEGLKDMDFDLDLIGFSDEELKEILFDNDSEIDFPELADGDKSPFQQKTFTLHNEQAGVVDDAITLARTQPTVDTGLNDNTNGNALVLICEEWLAANE